MFKIILKLIRTHKWNIQKQKLGDGLYKAEK